MKSVKFTGQVTSIRGKIDKSVGLNIATPELRPDEKSMFFELQGVNSEISIKPLEEKVEPYKIEKEVESKTPSQRLRAVLFIWWKQMGEKGEFGDFYKKHMELFIEHVKNKLEE